MSGYDMVELLVFINNVILKKSKLAVRLIRTICFYNELMDLCVSLTNFCLISSFCLFEHYPVLHLRQLDPGDAAWPEIQM